MSGNISLRAKSPLFFRGQTIGAGETFSCGALEAHDCLASRRCELVDADDQDRVYEAVQLADAALCPQRSSIRSILKRA